MNAALTLAEQAVEHTLRAIQEDGRKAYMMGLGTQTFNLLIAAEAERLGRDVDKFKREFWASCRPERVVPADR